ncbi:MAG: TIGR00303 family protein [Methanolinea sp.]|nr:TIGR00303 family protein [Methanolinea sp.]
MAFVSDTLSLSPQKPLFASVLANTMLSVVPGISGAGPTPQKTLLTPVLDAELVAHGEITSMPARPNTPTGCPTPASITRAVMDLCGVTPLFINAGLVHRPTVPCFDVYGEPGNDPRVMDAVPRAGELFEAGRFIGTFLSRACDMLVLGECVPGGTTTALCVLRGLGYPAQVSSSYVSNPTTMKEEVWKAVASRLEEKRPGSPLDVARYAGDPMIPVSAGIAAGFGGDLVLAGGTQMLAVCAVLKALDLPVPRVATTVYVRDDPSANFSETAETIGVAVAYVDPEFGDLGHSGLARYCIGEVKEGMGAGGAMFMAVLMGYSPDQIRNHILGTVMAYR